MTSFRFRYKRLGYLRWRCRTARGRAKQWGLPAAAQVPCAPLGARRRRLVAAATGPSRGPATLRVGQFLVSDEGDPQLTGHPDIRY